MAVLESVNIGRSRPNTHKSAVRRTGIDKRPATVGNGTMVALGAASREQVDAVHAKALELGGSDEGAPGQRWPGFYAAYFRDLDGKPDITVVQDSVDKVKQLGFIKETVDVPKYADLSLVEEAAKRRR